MAKKVRIKRHISECSEATQRNLERLCAAHREAKDEQAAAEHVAKTLMADIKKAIIRHKLEDVDTVTAETWELVKSRGSKRLNQTLLVENGVSVETIEASKVRGADYYQVRAVVPK